jgi:hypothetical protein
MPSTAFDYWATTRRIALDEIERAHAAVGGTAPGRRYATQQVNQAYAVLLASQFQGYCRDLHSECANFIVRIVAPPPTLRRLVQDEFSRGRQIDRGNAQPGSLGADFGRLGIDFWDEVDGFDPQCVNRRRQLQVLNDWRNAIAHQDFDPTVLGGTTTLRLQQVRKWRVACHGLAVVFDEVMRQHLQALAGRPPW